MTRQPRTPLQAILHRQITHPTPGQIPLTTLLDTYLAEHPLPGDESPRPERADVDLEPAGTSLVAEIEAFLIGVTMLTASARGSLGSPVTQAALYQVTINGTVYALAVTTVTTTAGPALHFTAPGPDADQTPFLPNGTYTVTLTYTDNTTQTATGSINRRTGDASIVVPTHHAPADITRLTIIPDTDA